MANQTTNGSSDLQSGFNSALRSLRKYTPVALVSWTLVIAAAFTWTMLDQGNQVDKSFVDGMTISRNDKQIVFTTIEPAKNPNKQALAEGIEAHEQ